MLVEAKNKQSEKDYSARVGGKLSDEVAQDLDKRMGAGFSEKLEELAEKLSCDPQDLVGVFASECGLDPTAVNPSSGATGLIQFMPSTAQSLGTTTAAIKNMSAVEQLDLVEKYFNNWGIQNLKNSEGKVTGGTLYTLVFLPAYAGKETLCSRGSDFYNSNTGLDVDGDGHITQTDLSNQVRKKYEAFYSA